MFGLDQCVLEQLSPTRQPPFVWEICCGNASARCHNHRRGARLHVPQECMTYMMQGRGKTTVEQCRVITVITHPTIWIQCDSRTKDIREMLEIKMTLLNRK